MSLVALSLTRSGNVEVNSSQAGLQYMLHSTVKTEDEWLPVVPQCPSLSCQSFGFGNPQCERAVNISSLLKASWTENSTARVTEGGALGTLLQGHCGKKSR